MILDVQASRPKAPAVVLLRLTNSQPPERSALAAFGLRIGSWHMDSRLLCFALLVFALFCGLPAASVKAAEKIKADTERVSPKDLKASPVFLTCFTIHPGELPKGQAPRNCNSYCMEKLALCTGVQSNLGPPPSCEDGMHEGDGNCRCCKVQQ
ncbi:MAG: hypothetical protein AB7E52_07155 [Bdellovibrionales bacterium]